MKMATNQLLYSLHEIVLEMVIYNNMLNSYLMIRLIRNN